MTDGDVVNMQWMGHAADIDQPWFRDFVTAGALVTPRLIWWVEPDLSGLADLLLTTEQTNDLPQRVRPYEWCHRVGGRYSRGWSDQADSVVCIDHSHPLPGERSL